MPNFADASPSVRFSIDGFSKGERASALRELLGRKLSRVELEPLSEEIRADVTARCVGGIGLLTIDHSLMNFSRTRELLADGDDALVFHIVGGGCRGSQLGRDIMLRPGEAGLISAGDTCSVACFGTTLMLRLARQELRPLISDFDAALRCRVPADASALQFLRGYIRLFDELPQAPAQLQHRFVTHVYDLVAMILGPSREVAEQARGRGVRAARLQAIQADILAHLADHTLSVRTVAARHGISTVYVRKLFEGESLSFSTFVLGNRLEAARRMLNDHRFRNRTIGAIAFDAGFGDLSYFNRAFRRRFGASPSDIRSEASRSWGDSAQA